mmetsp:Transcript_3493/g.10176  ORF Transcript_3493/g.10176 Transcript_3493/m.10176 type:complete len:195 (-) Transcript_3493:77-661(-)
MFSPWCCCAGEQESATCGREMGYGRPVATAARFDELPNDKQEALIDDLEAFDNVVSSIEDNMHTCMAAFMQKATAKGISLRLLQHDAPQATKHVLSLEGSNICFRPSLTCRKPPAGTTVALGSIGVRELLRVYRGAELVRSAPLAQEFEDLSVGVDTHDVPPLVFVLDDTDQAEEFYKCLTILAMAARDSERAL